MGTSTPIRVSEPVGGRCAHAPLFSEPLNEAFEKILEVKVIGPAVERFLTKKNFLHLYIGIPVLLIKRSERDALILLTLQLETHKFEN